MCANLEILCNYCSQRSASQEKPPARLGKLGTETAKNSHLVSKWLLPTLYWSRWGCPCSPGSHLCLFLRGCTRRNQHPWDWKKWGKTRILRFANQALAGGCRAGCGSSSPAVSQQHPWQCHEKEITSEVFCLNLIMVRAGFLLFFLILFS